MKHLEQLIDEAYPTIRQIVFHSDGRVIAKAGAKAKYPKRLYNGKGNDLQERMINAVEKLIKENL